MEEIEALVRKHRFRGTSLRYNVAADQPMTKTRNGRTVLCKKIKSDILREGPLFDAVYKMHPWIEQITVNYNLQCTPHVDKNEGESLFAMFGDFEGGALAVDTPEGLQTFTAKNTWHCFNGRHQHWTQAFSGDRWSIVAYKKKNHLHGGAGKEVGAAWPGDLGPLPKHFRQEEGGHQL